MIKHALRFAALGLVALGSTPANAITVSETTDFNYFTVFALDAGANTISGSLAGSCVDSGWIDCNPGTEDTQDSFQVEVGSGYAIDSLTVTTSNVSGPTGFSVSFNFSDSDYNTLALDYALPLDSTTSNMIASAVGPGIYHVSIWGQQALETGPFSLDYSVDINVSAVPVPAAAWLFGSGLLGLVSIARRRRVA